MKFLRSFLSVVILTSVVATQVQANPFTNFVNRAKAYLPAMPKVSMPSVSLPKMQMPTKEGVQAFVNSGIAQLPSREALQAVPRAAYNAVVSACQAHPKIAIAVPAVLATAGVVFAARKAIEAKVTSAMRRGL